MKANITFNDDGYIIHFGTDDINGTYEIPEGFEYDHLFCYHLVNGELILDEAKKQAEIEADGKAEEIAVLQRDLDDTDYITARCFEEVMALDKPLTFITDMIAILVKYANQYKTVLQQRKQWRARIEELRNETE